MRAEGGCDTGSRRSYRGLQGILLAVLVLTACESAPVAEHVSLPEANEIVSELSGQGIAAAVEKERGAAGRYLVSVRQSLYAEAAAVLRERQLPRPARESFASVVQPHGLLPNTRELEALRVDYALAVQLEELLATLPAVDSVRAVIRSSFGPSPEGPSVSVIIRERREQFVDRQAVLQTIARVIPGISEDRVRLDVAQASHSAGPLSAAGTIQSGGRVMSVPLTSFVARFRIAEEDYNGLALVFIGCILFVGVIGGCVGYWYGRYLQLQRAGRGAMMPKVLTGGQRKELEEP